MSYAPIKNKTNKSHNEYLPIRPISNDLNSTQLSTRTPTPIPSSKPSSNKSSFITSQNLSRTRPLFAPLKERRIERSNEIPYLHSLERQNNLSSQRESSNDITMIDVSMSNDNSMTDNNHMDDVPMTPKQSIKYSATTPQEVQRTNRSSLYQYDDIISPPIPRSLIHDFDTIN